MRESMPCDNDDARAIEILSSATMIRYRPMGRKQIDLVLRQLGRPIAPDSDTPTLAEVLENMPWSRRLQELLDLSINLDVFRYNLAPHWSPEDPAFNHQAVASLVYLNSLPAYGGLETIMHDLWYTRVLDQTWDRARVACLYRQMPWEEELPVPKWEDYLDMAELVGSARTPLCFAPPAPGAIPSFETSAGCMRTVRAALRARELDSLQSLVAGRLARPRGWRPRTPTICGATEPACALINESHARLAKLLMHFTPPL